VKKMKLFNMITILMVTLLALSGCPVGEHVLTLSCRVAAS